MTTIDPQVLAAAVTAELSRRDSVAKALTNRYFWCDGTTTYHVWDYADLDGQETYTCKVCGFATSKAELKAHTDRARPQRA